VQQGVYGEQTGQYGDKNAYSHCAFPGRAEFWMHIREEFSRNKPVARHCQKYAGPAEHHYKKDRSNSRHPGRRYNEFRPGQAGLPERVCYRRVLA
jgi:hypothetical protein